MEESLDKELKRQNIQFEVRDELSEKSAIIKMNGVIHVDDVNIDSVMSNLKGRIEEILQECKYSDIKRKQKVDDLIEDAKSELKRMANISRNDEFDEKYDNMIKFISIEIDKLYEEPSEEGIEQYKRETDNFTQNTFEEATKNSIQTNSNQNADVLLNLKYNVLRYLQLDGLSEVEIKKIMSNTEEKLNEYYKENSDKMNGNLSNVVEDVARKVEEQCQKDFEFGEYSKERQEQRKKLEDIFL